MIDTYPWKTAACGANNPHNCNYAYRNCTDACQWWLRQMGLPCMALGDAHQWRDRAAALGHPHDAQARVWDIMCLQPGAQGASASAGHVAQVIELRGARVLVRQYNWIACDYNEQTFAVHAPGTDFIHFAPPSTPAPPPSLKEQPGMDAYFDTAQNNYHFFYVDGGGTLHEVYGPDAGGWHQGFHTSGCAPLSTVRALQIKGAWNVRAVKADGSTLGIWWDGKQWQRNDA